MFFTLRIWSDNDALTGEGRGAELARIYAPRRAEDAAAAITKLDEYRSRRGG